MRVSLYLTNFAKDLALEVTEKERARQPTKTQKLNRRNPEHKRAPIISKDFGKYLHLVKNAKQMGYLKPKTKTKRGVLV